MDVASLIVKVTTTGIQTTQAQLDRLANTASNAQKTAGGLNLGMIGLTATLGLLTKEAIKMGDEWTNINSKLNLVTKTTQEFNKAQTELFNISQNTRTSLTATVELYRKLSVSTESLNISQNRLLKVTETINKASIIGGGSKESINAALIQLGQGLASGALRGEELNSVLEQTPRLAKLIADGMGVQVGALKSLAEAGKITSETIIKAAEAGEKGIAKEFDVVQVTVSSAMEVIQGSITKTVGTLDSATGATRSLSESMIELSKYLNQNNTDIVATGQFIYATIERTIDVFNVLYETVENTGQIVIGHINLLAYGSLEVILTMLTKVTEGLNVLGIASDKGLKEAYADLAYVQGLVANANNLIADSYDDLNKAVIKLSPTIEDRIKQYNSENKAITEKLALQKKELEQNQTKGKSKLEVEAELKLEKEKEDKKKKAQKEAEKLAEEWSKRKIELATETAIAEQDEMSKPYILLQAEYEADLKKYGHNKDAKAELDRNYEAKKEKLNKETIKKFEDGLEKEAKKSAEWQIKMLEANEKYNDEIIKLQDEMYGTDSSIDAWYNNQLEYLGKLSQEAGATAEELQTLLDKIETLKAMKLEKQTISFKVEQSFYQSFEDNLADSIEDAFNGNLNLSSFFRNIGNDLLKTLSSSFASVGTSALRGNYSSVLGLLGTSAIGSTVSASEIGSLMNSGGVFDSATNLLTTSGGSVIKLGADGSGTIASGGSDILSLASTVSSLKTAYGVATQGLGNYVSGMYSGFTGAIDAGLGYLGMGGSVGGGAMFVNPTTLYSTSSAMGNGVFVNPSTLTAQSTLPSGGVAAQGASYGAIAGGTLAGGAVGYGVGSGLDSMFGAKTYAPVTFAASGAVLGGAAAASGGLTAGLAAMGPYGWAALAIVAIAGGLIGKKQLKEIGFSFDQNMSGESLDMGGVQSYEDWEKKSWFSSKSWTNFKELSSAEKSYIESMFTTYQYLFDTLQNGQYIWLDAGKYTSEELTDQLARNFVEGFTQIPQFIQVELEREIPGMWGDFNDNVGNSIVGAMETYTSNESNPAFRELFATWTTYAESVDKTVMQALSESVSQFVQSKREYTLWDLNRNGKTTEALMLQAGYAVQDFDNLAKSMNVTGITIENFLDRYEEAVKNSFDPQTIAQWDALGDSLMKAVDANKAYTDSIVDVEKEALIAAQTLQNNFVTSIENIVKTLQDKYNPALKTTTDIMTRFAELTGIDGIYNVKSWEESAGALGATKANEEALTLFGAIGEAMYQLEAQVKITVASLLKQGKALEAFNLAFSIADKPNFKDFTDKDGNFYANGFNVAYAKAETELAKKLAEDISANALFVENAMDAFQVLNQKIIETTQSKYGILFQDAYQRVAYSIAEAVTGSAEKTSKYYNIIGITTEFSKVVAEKQGMGYLPSGQGIADLMNKEAQAAYVGSSHLSSRLGQDIFGEDMYGFDQALTSLDGALKKQIITTEEYTKAVEYLSNDVYDLVQGTDDLMAFYKDIEAQMLRAAQAQYAVYTQAVTSTEYYFDVITKSADTYLDTIKATGESMAVASSAIGRFNSMMDVFNYTTSRINVDAIKNNFGDYENAQFVKETGMLIAKAAGIASAEVTTADAKLAAERISNTASFSDTDATTIQRLSLMFDGFQAFDSGAFENTLMLINSELIKGNITQEQYIDLFNQSLDIYRDVEQEQLNTLKSIENIVADISDYQRELLYGDLSTLSLSEKYAGAKEDTMGLYAQAKTALMGGDLDLFETLFNDFKGVSTNFLTVSKDFVANNEAYVQDFTSVFGALADLKSLATQSGLNVGSDLNYLKIDGSHANGLNYVPYDGYIAELHKGERVQTANEARSNDALASEIRLLRQELKESNNAIISNTQRTAKILDRWDADGQPEERVV